MFSKTLVVVALVAGALAAPSNWGSSGQCTTKDQFCCDQVQSSNDPQLAAIAASLGIPVHADIPLGLTCNPISVIAAAGNKCEQKPVCCNKYDSAQLVGVNCTPISVLS